MFDLDKIRVYPRFTINRFHYILFHNVLFKSKILLLFGCKGNTVKYKSKGWYV
jgi:hypothetical protein